MTAVAATAGDSGRAPAEPTGRVRRFTGTERIVHWTTAAAMVSLVGTGLILYVGQLSGLVGRRELIRTIHVWSGFALAVPLLVGLLGPWRGALVADLRRLNRWTAYDRRWILRRRVRVAAVDRPAAAPIGKFNAGQKLFAAFAGGSIPVMLATGSVMHWFDHFAVDLRTGATFVHDWVAIGLFVAVPFHIVKALSEPVLLRAMVRGWVPRRWADVHRPRWLAADPPEAGQT
ncbi:MAG TPA: cytochrome b/b6 domain-containing protein [Acidimicrobiales bacterium]|jgi:formate dehydrogenase subunit gamma|nr:cytochrome b/b6 domain-containing protein [Acidimicrobiales bacterium]